MDEVLLAYIWPRQLIHKLRDHLSKLPIPPADRKQALVDAANAIGFQLTQEDIIIATGTSML